MSDEIILLLLTLGWVPILAIGALISEIGEAIANMIRSKCEHNLVYDEIQIIDDYSDIPRNVSVSVTCTKCGYHKSYLKYKN